MKHRIISTILLSATVPVLTGEAAEFIPLGTLPGGTFNSAIDLSSDGSTVLGSGNSDTGAKNFRWSVETGFSILPSFDVTSISGDGSVVGGSLFTPGTDDIPASIQGVTWTASGGFVPFGILPTQPDQFPFSISIDISSDGTASAVTGTSLETPFTSAQFWSSSTGLLFLGFLPEDQPEPLLPSFSFANAISGDGQVVVGSSAATKHSDRGDQAFRWSAAAGMQALGFLTDAVQSSATAVSADGSVIVGVSGTEAFRWTAETGLEPLGVFFPTGVSANGNVVVGTVDVDFQPVAMVWTPESALQTLQTYLQTTANVTLPGWTGLSDVVGVSDDGLVLAGNGINAAGQPEAFMAILDPAVVTSGSIAFSGSVSPFLVDPEGKRFGKSPENGVDYSEIPDLSLAQDGGLSTASWPNIVAGNHLLYLTGTASGEYQLQFDFLHEDTEHSGQSFTSRLLQGGVHVYEAAISVESASASQYRLVYADSDGDDVVDGSDTYPYSDLRATVIIDTTDTGLPNRILADGSSLNDIINAAAAKATNHGEFVSAVAKLTKLWTAEGLMPKEAKSLVQTAAAQASLP